jgi:hypothetical protein
LARVVVSIFREHTVRRHLNPPSLPHCLTVKGDAVSFDAYHTLAVEGSPGTLPFLASNGEVTAANDARRFESVASAFDLLGVTGIELQNEWLPSALRNSTETMEEPASKMKRLMISVLGGLSTVAHGKKKRREALASLKEQ